MLSAATFSALQALRVHSIVVDPLNGGFNALPSDVREMLLAEPVLGCEVLMPPPDGQKWKRKWRKPKRSFETLRRKTAVINRGYVLTSNRPLALALLTVGVPSALASLVSCTPLRAQPLSPHLPPLRWLESDDAHVTEQAELLSAWLRRDRGDPLESVAHHVFGHASPHALVWAQYLIAISADVRQRVAAKNRPLTEEFIA